MLVSFTTTAPAAQFFDYGFTLVDNSPGGSVLDGYVSQQMWADTELLLLGAQLRIELDAGSLFQDTFGGSEFSFGAPHDVLVAAQPSLAFDTHVGIDRAAPGIVAGGAVNLGGESGILFNSSEINAAWSAGHGNFRTGRFDLGMITLSGDASGRGALLLSGAGDERSGRFESEMIAHVFEIESGVIRLVGESVSSLDWMFVSLDREFVPQRPPLPEPFEPTTDDVPTKQAPPFVADDEEWEPMDPSPPIVIDLDPFGPPEQLQTESPFDGDSTTDPAGVPTEFVIYVPRPRPGVGSDVFYPSGGGTVDLAYGDFELLSLELASLLELMASATKDDSLMLAPTDLSLLRALDGTQAAHFAAAFGELAIPLSSLPSDAVDDLVASGNWNVHGANLVFGIRGGVPEPGSLLIAVVAAAVAGFWRISGYCNVKA